MKLYRLTGDSLIVKIQFDCQRASLGTTWDVWCETPSCAAFKCFLCFFFNFLVMERAHREN